MALNDSKYPGYLNPFGDIEEEEQENSKTSIVVSVNEYPDHLDPFGDDDEKISPADDYDDSLNPFGDEAVPEMSQTDEVTASTKQQTQAGRDDPKGEPSEDEGNPFADDDDNESSVNVGEQRSINPELAQIKESPSPDSIEPPKPLPRTKSLLKKEQAHKRRLQEQQVLNADQQQAYSIQSTTSSTTSSSSTTTDKNPSLLNAGSFQRRKNKRLAPPVPVNFKRQVSGSLDAIEEELNEIGDKLAIIDKESTLCQETLTANGHVEEADLRSTKSKFAELIKRRNSIVRRQKELMYKKRELRLDQLHSDIEYELRMIGNKQMSTRTEDDEIKEKELLKKLVEIVEEKNDIVENLNKDTSCDTRDVDEAFKRLNITMHPLEDFEDKKHNNNLTTATSPSTTITTTTTTTKFLSKKESCDKSGLAKLSKIATLLPKSNTIKLKRKRLFKRDCDSQPIGR